MLNKNLLVFLALSACSASCMNPDSFPQKFRNDDIFESTMLDLDIAIISQDCDSIDKAIESARKLPITNVDRAQKVIDSFAHRYQVSPARVGLMLGNHAALAANQPILTCKTKSQKTCWLHQAIFCASKKDAHCAELNNLLYIYKQSCFFNTPTDLLASLKQVKSKKFHCQWSYDKTHKVMLTGLFTTANQLIPSLHRKKNYKFQQFVAGAKIDWKHHHGLSVKDIDVEYVTLKSPASCGNAIVGFGFATDKIDSPTEQEIRQYVLLMHYDLDSSVFKATAFPLIAPQE